MGRDVLWLNPADSSVLLKEIGRQLVEQDRNIHRIVEHKARKELFDRSIPWR